MTTIPASLFVEVTPSVLSAAGNAVDAIGLVLTKNTRVPIGTVVSFPDELAVADYFGPASHQAAIAEVYFGGYEGATAQPGSMLWTQYPAAAVSAWLRGGNISALPLATLKGYSGTLSVTIDGSPYSESIDLSGATSFTNAAEIIGATLGIVGVQEAAFSGTISSTVLTVDSVSSGVLAVGQTIAGASVTSNTYISSLGTGTGGTGTYNLSASSSVGSPEDMTSYSPAVQYDSVSGAFIINSGTTGTGSTIAFGSGALATDLLLTQATGAVTSQGAAAAVPAAFMTGVTVLTTDWVSFMTDFDPDGGSGNAVKQEFAAWNTEQDDEFVYVCWDIDVTPTETVPATSSLGYILQQNGNSGTCLVYEPSDLYLAVFVCGMIASINFQQPNGRITTAYKSQAGLTAGVTTGEVAINLGGSPQVLGSFGNGYNYFGAVGAANAGFLWFQRGTITGPYAWLDSYVNQIVLNSALQVALLTFLGNVGSVPFNPAGASLIEQALAPTIQQYGNPAQGGFGAFAPGSISAAQVAAVNNAANANISDVLQTQGWYLQVNPAPANVEANRGPWAITFFYLDRGSVQSISLSSIAVQ